MLYKCTATLYAFHDHKNRRYVTLHVCSVSSIDFKMTIEGIIQLSSSTILARKHRSTYYHMLILKYCYTDALSDAGADLLAEVAFSISLWETSGFLPH